MTTDRRIARAALAWLAAAALAVADDAPREDVPAESLGVQLVVLTSGRVVSGAVESGPKGYQIELPSGTMFVPRDQVRYVCVDLPEAYRAYRADLPEDTAAWHMSLARWCVANRLWNEARAECRRGLQLEPQREECRLLLARIDDLAAGPAPAEPPAERETRSPAPAVEALAGLPEDVAVQFTRQVQPILMNACGAAHCHGPAARNDFRLELARGVGTNRQTAEQNLAVLTRYIDLAEPDDSPLLLRPQGNHGRQGRSVFVGKAGTKQLAALRDWVRLVAEHKAPPTRHLADAKPVIRRPRSAEPADLPEFQPEKSPAASPAIQQAAASVAETDPDLPPTRPDDADDYPETLVDEFDPGVFNRKYRKPARRF